MGRSAHLFEPGTYYAQHIRGVLFINPRSGRGGPSADELARAAEQRGVTPHVVRHTDDLAELARGADAQALGIAGGDGSLAAVAGVAVERDLPFVCVPFGTRNHFARDLGLERDDPLAALGAFDGDERRVDIGRVGERVFLNNVSIGLYARLVHRRERHRRRREALAGARAFALLARRRHPLRLIVDGAPISAFVVLVASNHYELHLFDVGARERLDDGLLHLYVALGMMPRTWEERAARSFLIDATQKRLPVAVDGEPEMLDTPVQFRIEPRALRVLLPAQTE
jgi:diacylglycerol kinase family enzyme